MLLFYHSVFSIFKSVCQCSVVFLHLPTTCKYRQFWPVFLFYYVLQDFQNRPLPFSLVAFFATSITFKFPFFAGTGQVVIPYVLISFHQKGRRVSPYATVAASLAGVGALVGKGFFTERNAQDVAPVRVLLIHCQSIKNI